MFLTYLKNTILSVCLIIVVLANYVHAQSPPDIQVAGLEENWLYISKDTNFIQSPEDPFSSPYWGRHVIEFHEVKGSLYIFEQMVSQSPYSGFEGTLLHKLDMNTGEPIWINHNNTYVGNVFRESYTIGGLYLSDGKVEIVGYRSIDSIDFNKLGFGFHATPIKRIIDDENGELLKTVVSVDTFRDRRQGVGGGANRIIRLSNGKYVQASKVLENAPDGELLNTIEIYEISDSMKFDSVVLDSIVYHTGLDTAPALSIIPQHRMLSGDTMVVAFGAIDSVSQEKSPKEFVLKWYNIADPNNLIELYNVEISDSLFYPQESNNSDISITTVDGNVIVTQHCHDRMNEPAEFDWLMWLDRNGRVVRKEGMVGDKGREHYQFLQVIDIYNNDLYAIGYVNNFQFHILHIPNNKDVEVSKVGEWRVENTEDILGVSHTGSKICKNEQVIINFRVSALNNNGRSTNYNYYYSYDLQDIGILTSTKNIKTVSNQMSIMPNPTSDNVQLEFFEQQFSGRVYVQSLDGRILYENYVSTNSSINISLNYLPTGAYILLAIGDDGQYYSEKLVIE